MPDDTPMMRQYNSIKKEHSDAVLFFRMGDFYEMFGVDAEEVSKLLNITLTKRQNIPMCGIPYHASQNYIAKLLNLGLRVAICEQTSTPEKGKAIVDRKVVEVISPGTIVDEVFLEQNKNNYLLGIALQGKNLSVAIVDFSTGEFRSGSYHAPSKATIQEFIRKEYYQINPREILLMDSLWDALPADISNSKTMINTIPDWHFDVESALKLLCKQFSVGSLKGFGFENSAPALGAAGAILEYLQETSLNIVPHINKISPLYDTQNVQLDSNALRNLEILTNLQDNTEAYSLWSVVQHCQTAMGSRKLRNWLLHPLRSKEEIEQRLDKVELLYLDQNLLERLRGKLKNILDIERLSTKVLLDRAHGKDMLAISNSLKQIFAAYELISTKPLLSSIFTDATMRRLEELQEYLERAIYEEASVILHAGKLIKRGFNQELDELYNIKNNGKQLLEDYLHEERVNSKITNLRIKYNGIIGYFFELSKASISSVPGHFIRRQSLVSSERYTTEKLAELETKINSVDAELLSLERELFSKVRDHSKLYTEDLGIIAGQIANIDCLAGFAYLATIESYTRPEILGQDDPSSMIKISGGRHPVVAHYLADGEFVPNDCLLDKDKFFGLITGPNMAGKSTYLRQVALISLLTQCGSFVPAKIAQMSLVDKIFCRVGASDNLSMGESTFLVEMHETARILNNASSKSLIIMDEVGRGTSTQDGLAIAWSICEYILQKIGAKTLFATHYHELTTLNNEHMQNLSLAVKEDGKQITFLKKIKPGAATSSYGVHVAALAGIPASVIRRASQLLQENLSRVSFNSPNSSEDNFAEEPSPTDKKATGYPSKNKIQNGLLFSAETLLLQELRSLNIDKINPLKALNIIADWQKDFANDLVDNKVDNAPKL